MRDFNQIIDDKVTALDAARRENHIPSGKLSAGMLSWPIQWSVLKIIGVPDVPPDVYALRKFARGNQVEDWFVEMVKEDCGGETQVEVEYRGCVGFADLVDDNREPHEVKSVTNLKWKRIVQGYKTKNTPPAGPQFGHKLQAGLYALGLEADKAHLHYIASDDLRLATYTIPTEDVAPVIDETIDQVELALISGVIPIFEQREAWHNMPEYAKYLEWMQLSGDEIDEKLQREFPQAWGKLHNMEVENAASLS